MSVSFDYRRTEDKIKRLQEKLTKEEDPIKRELLHIDLEEKVYSKASAKLVAGDRMREIKLWSKFKKQFDDGPLYTKKVNTHQLNSYQLTMINKAETLTQGSSQPEVLNVLGQLQSIERIKKENVQIEATKKPELPGLGAKPE